MICYNCKGKISDQARFCPKCGQTQGFDAALIRAAAAGNERALTELYQKTYNSVYNTVSFLIKDEDAALDIIQDSYLKGFRALLTLEDPEKFGPWIRRIAHNRAVDYLRSNKTVLFSQMTSDDQTEMPELPDERPENQPDIVIDRQETARLLGKILDSLPDDQRACITLYYYEMLSVREIAGELGISEATVKSRLLYGRKKIESGVRSLEAKGTKLYGLAPVPFLLLLFRSKTVQAAERPSSAILSHLLAESAGRSGAAVSSAGRAPTPRPAAKRPSSAAVQRTASAAKGRAAVPALRAAEKTGLSLAAKVLAGVAAASLIGAGVFLWRQSTVEDRPERSERIEEASEKSRKSSSREESAGEAVKEAAEESVSEEKTDHGTGVRVDQPNVPAEVGSIATVLNDDGSRLMYKIVYGSDTQTFRYVYDEYGRLITRETMEEPGSEVTAVRSFDYQADGTLIRWSDDLGFEARYNEEGICVYSEDSAGNIREYDDTGKLTHRYVAREARHYHYAYDDQGRILSEEEYRGDENDPYGTFSGRTEYFYSDDGSELTMQLYDTEGNLSEYPGGYGRKQKFDSEGRLVYETMSSLTEEHYVEYNYSYDEKGSKTGQEHYISGVLAEEEHWIYDDQGNLMEDVRSTGSSTEYLFYERDPEGKLIKLTRRVDDHVGSLEYVEELYEYDEHGHVSRKYVFESPDYDIQTGEFLLQYETYGTERFKTMTEFIYDYDEP